MTDIILTYEHIPLEEKRQMLGGAILKCNDEKILNSVMHLCWLSGLIDAEPLKKKIKREGV